MTHKNTIVYVTCSHCGAPSQVPKSVEKYIDTIHGFDCYDCGRKVHITQDFINYVKATREVEE